MNYQTLTILWYIASKTYNRFLSKLVNNNEYHCTFPGNGYITTKVLREILRELDDKISAEELDMMIEEIDSDGSGTVDFDGMYSRLKSRCLTFKVHIAWQKRLLST